MTPASVSGRGSCGLQVLMSAGVVAASARLPPVPAAARRTRFAWAVTMPTVRREIRPLWRLRQAAIRSSSESSWLLTYLMSVHWTGPCVE